MNEIIINPSSDTWPSLMQRPQMDTVELERTVNDIINSVKQNGDAALKEFTAKLDGFSTGNFLVTPEEIFAAASSINKDLKKAIDTAKKNIKKFHLSQKEKIKKIETMPGVICWRKSVAIEKIGLYIPGGSAPLFSTLLMLAIPARIAGCEDITVCTPADKNGNIHAAILYVAKLLGITKVYKLGGAQAIAAMAYGTVTINKVDKIFGPGNQYVTCAKKLVSLHGVAIDMPAGPSELAVYADETCTPSFVAADLLSQAEHGPDSQVVLITNTKKILEEIGKEIIQQSALLPRKDVIEKSLHNSRYLIFDKVKDAFDFLNEYAPEHLSVASKNYKEMTGLIKNAGSVFLGSYSAESAGDYASGTNHSLPTNGYAKLYSGVSVDSFVKKITFQKINKKGIKNIGPTVKKMAEAEGLFAHKNAISIRMKYKK